MEQKRQRDVKIWWREDEFIALWRSVYGRDVRGRRKEGGWRRGKSDRLDYESTHRRTLFNVSLTFLLSISSPPTLSRWRRMGQGRESGERAHTRVWEETQHSACTSLKVTSPRQSQRSGFIGGPANQRASKSGGGIRFHHQGVSLIVLLCRLLASASSSLTIFFSFWWCCLTSRSLILVHVMALLRSCRNVTMWENWAGLLEFLQGSLEAT